MSQNNTYLGRLGRDPDLKYIKESGKAVATFSLAVTRPHNSKEIDWLDFEVWEKGAEYIAQYGKKGNLVWVEGWLCNASYKNKEDKKISKWIIKVDRCNIISSKPLSAEESEEE